MDPALSSDDSCDSEMKNMKSQLSEFGLDEENLSKEEMADLLKALNNSKSSATEDDIMRRKDNVAESKSTTPKRSLKRRYLNVKDRRMPWSLMPNQLTQAEKARVLAVYIKVMSLNNYRQARQSPNFMSWPPPLQIIEESTRIQPLRSTRSGRNVPVYSGFDDDSSDLDFVVTKTKKRKISNSEHAAPEATHIGRTVSLKRKPSKDDNTRTVKELKMDSDNVSPDSTKPQNNPKSIFTLIKD